MSAKKITAKDVGAMSEEELMELLHTVLAPRLASVDPKDLIFVKPHAGVAGKYLVTVGGQRLSSTQANNLRKEAEMLAQTEIYKLITATLTNYAQRQMFSQAKSFDDMRSGKMLLYAISIIEQVVKGCANMHTTQLSTSPGRASGV